MTGLVTTIEDGIRSRATARPRDDRQSADRAPNSLCCHDNFVGFQRKQKLSPLKTGANPHMEWIKDFADFRLNPALNACCSSVRRKVDLTETSQRRPLSGASGLHE